MRSFDQFDGDNDPYHEHDMAFFEEDGEPYFLKIDYYAPDTRHGSDDPADPQKTRRTLTIGVGIGLLIAQRPCAGVLAGAGIPALPLWDLIQQATLTVQNADGEPWQTEADDVSLNISVEPGFLAARASALAARR